MEKLTPFFAADGQYLEVNHRHGPRECVLGPAQLFWNPVEVESIAVRDAVLVSANEALVIYRSPDRNQNLEKLGREEAGSSFERAVLYGPLRYVPKPGEWIHEFSWHGTDPNDHNKTRKVAGALKVKLLSVIPDCFYYNVREVKWSLGFNLMT